MAVSAKRPAARTPQTRANGLGPYAVLILSAGAPQSPLTAGALYAIREAGFTFHIIYASGGGGLVGALSVAPKRQTPLDALRDIVEVGVADPIYRFFPIGYKTFFKPGPFTPIFRRLAEALKQPVSPRHVYKHRPYELSDEQRRRRLFNDGIDFWASALTPTTLNPLSKGLCAPPPFIDELIDFPALNARDLEHLPFTFVVNAYDVTKGRPQLFGTPALDGARMRAAFAFPFIYPPAEVDGDAYYEGAVYDPLPRPEEQPAPKTIRQQLEAFYDGQRKRNGRGRSNGDIDPLPGGGPHIPPFPLPTLNLIVIDTLASLASAIIRAPRNLLDAYGLSVITPIVSLAQASLDKMLPHPGPRQGKTAGQPDPVYRIGFDIPPDRRETMLDWSYDNLCALWDIGYAAGADWIGDPDNQRLLPRLQARSRQR